MSCCGHREYPSLLAACCGGGARRQSVMDRCVVLSTRNTNPVPVGVVLVFCLLHNNNDAETSVWTEEYFTAWSSSANKSHVETSDEPFAFHGRILQFKLEAAAHCIETRRLPVCPLSLGCVRVAKRVCGDTAKSSHHCMTI